MATQGNSSLYHIDAGILKENACVVLVKTEWNAAIVDALEDGCKRIFDQYKIRYQTLVVPGAVELPFAIKRHWERTKEGAAPDAFIALGCVIKGDTPHFDYVCDAVTQGILQLNLMLPVPTIFGVLTVNTDEQAQERIGGAHGHKGEEAAITALKMIHS
ncbi:6,7-dimethyl-8-ribityllumazine synthase [Niabella sp.]|uniref:6,7-dimethyl-8-ribityllumazine synthase n=1 Tax=Niabella sp. TaxID=1962976 RepID=UPI0026274185|nr:6,7-dimethyl-8-ribityllumazine synthase [Niabella sp.]